MLSTVAEALAPDFVLVFGVAATSVYAYLILRLESKSVAMMVAASGVCGPDERRALGRPGTGRAADLRPQGGAQLAWLTVLML
jgi:hypothetical protein